MDLKNTNGVKELKIDLNTRLYVRFDDSESFKSLMNFMADVLKDSDIYMVFNKNHIKIHHRLTDQNTKMVLDVCARIDMWNLTQYYYQSKYPIYILGLEMKSFYFTIKSCKKGDFFILEREGNEKGGVRTSKSPKEFKYRSQVEIDNYKPFLELKYETPRSEPICVMTGKDFSDMCTNFQQDSDASTINLQIFKGGIICSSSDTDGSDKIIRGQVRILGEPPQDGMGGVKCYTSRFNLIKLSKVDRICSGGNIKIYFERDENKKLKPLKLVYNIGSVGELSCYLEIKEFEN